MGIINLDKFYFKKGADNTYDPAGEYAPLLEYVGISKSSNLGGCEFFREYNETKAPYKIIEHIDVPQSIRIYDPEFITKPLWTGKTFRSGAECRPASKYDVNILSCLDLSSSYEDWHREPATLRNNAGVVLLTGGGGGGGGGDAGGWLDEPSGGGGGGSGAWALFYYRFKKPIDDIDKTLEIKFGDSSNTELGNFQGAGGSAQTTGGTGASAFLVYDGTILISCHGGGGGVGSGGANSVAGGSGGSVSHTVHSSGSGVVLVNDSNLYLYLISEGGGVPGQGSGEGGVGGQAQGVAAFSLTVPSIIDHVLNIGGYGGGYGGKSNQDDPGGGGGAGSICIKGGDGSTGDAAAIAGGIGAGGGGGSERNTAGANGGYASFCLYLTYANIEEQDPSQREPKPDY